MCGFLDRPCPGPFTGAALPPAERPALARSSLRGGAVTLERALQLHTPLQTSNNR
jgi:hypothetical protein